MKNLRKPLFLLAPLLAGGLLLSSCSSTAMEPLNLPTPGPSTARPTPSPTAADTVEDASDALGSTVVDPNAVDVGDATADYSVEDKKAAYEWVAEFLPKMYQYTGYWNNGLNAASFVPTSYWPFTSFILPAYWDKEVNPKLLGQPELEANKEWFQGLGPVPPIIDGYWSSPAVTGFKIGEPTFTVVNGELVVSLSYTAQGIYNNKRGSSFYRLPISGSVEYSLVKSNGEWFISGWNNTGPEYGEPVKIPASSVNAPPVVDPGPTVAPQATLTQEDIDRINAENERKYGNGSGS